MILELTCGFQILELDWAAASAGRRSAAGARTDSCWRAAAALPVPRRVPSVRLKRSVLIGHAHLFHHREAGAGNHQQGVFFRRIHGHAVFAGHRRDRRTR